MYLTLERRNAMTEDKHNAYSLNILYAASWTVQACMGLIGIAIPIYAYLLGAPPFFLGLIGAAGGITYSIMPIIFGKFSDRLARKRAVLTSMAFYALACILYILSQDFVTLIFIRLIDAASQVLFWPIVEAMIAEGVGKGTLEKALSKFNVSWGSAMPVSPLIGGLLMSLFNNVKVPIYASLMGVILTFPMILSVHSTSVNPKAGASPEVLRAKSHSSVLVALISAFSFGFVTGIIFAFFPAFGTYLGMQPFEIGAVLFTLGLFKTLIFSQATRIEAKFKTGPVFLLGSALAASSLIIIALGSTTTVFLLSLAVLGLGTGLGYSESIFLTLREAGSSRGFAAGAFESFIGLGYFLGPLMGGLTSEASLRTPYMLGALVSITVFFAQFLFIKKAELKL